MNSEFFLKCPHGIKRGLLRVFFKEGRTTKPVKSERINVGKDKSKIQTLFTNLVAEVAIIEASAVATIKIIEIIGLNGKLEIDCTRLQEVNEDELKEKLSYMAGVKH